MLKMSVFLPLLIDNFYVVRYNENRNPFMEGIAMAWSYERLWILLIKKKMKKIDLLRVSKINANALARMGKDLPVTMDNLGKICKTLHCELEDIVQYIPDEEEGAE